MMYPFMTSGGARDMKKCDDDNRLFSSRHLLPGQRTDHPPCPPNALSSRSSYAVYHLSFDEAGLLVWHFDSKRYDNSHRKSFVVLNLLQLSSGHRC